KSLTRTGSRAFTSICRKRRKARRLQKQHGQMPAERALPQIQKAPLRIPGSPGTPASRFPLWTNSTIPHQYYNEKAVPRQEHADWYHIRSRSSCRGIFSTSPGNRILYYRKNPERKSLCHILSCSTPDTAGEIPEPCITGARK